MADVMRVPLTAFQGETSMTSFLPLIEAFLALGLTMIVLTTGVSSLSGTWERLFRSRARGMRELLRCLFLLAVKKIQAPPSSVIPPASGQPPTTPANGWQQFEGAIGETDALLRFVGEMSLQPGTLAKIAELTKQIDGYKAALPGLVETETAEAQEEEFPTPLKWKIWRSLADTLDNLSDDEFKTRFKTSTIGKALEQADPKGFEDRVKALHEQFVAFGHAASEAFTRNARQQSIIFAVILAFCANIDAFNLLETYLANPSLTAAVIQKYEKIGANQATSTQQPAKTDSAATPIQKINELRDLAISLASKEKQKDIEDKANQAKEVVQASQTAYDEARQVVSNATTNFPVGWDRYPGCAEKSADPRCDGIAAARKAKEDAAQNAPAPAQKAYKTPPSSPASNLFPIANFLDPLLTPFRDIHFAFENDARRALRWSMGVLLAILMLGLGTPFWVQTVDGMLRARDLVRGGNKAGDGTNKDQAEKK